MIKLKIFFLALSGMIMLYSCNGGSSGKQGAAKTETPKALQDDKVSLSSYGRSSSYSDLVEEIYKELSGKSETLRNLEDELEHSASERVKLEERFTTFDQKSQSYYSSANAHASNIKDSILKGRIMEYILKSSGQYAIQTRELHSLQKIISDNVTTLSDHHSILKIVLTLPVVERYQDENAPGKKEFKDIIRQQQKHLELMDSLTPGLQH